MKETEETKKSCVLLGCDRKAVGLCNNCRIPVCDIHGKRMNNVYICVNCFGYMKKAKLR